MKIDLVYTWVNGNDKDWQKEKQYWQEKLNLPSNEIMNKCRYTDNQELRYSLRSVAKNAPWINHIYIVTNGQVPEWLDTSHPKITIVKHEEIMPKDALPTFSTCSIEACVCHIPNLSEYFLISNDDNFMNKPVKPDFFFTKDNKPIVRLAPTNWDENLLKQNQYCAMFTYNIKLIKDKLQKDFSGYETCHNIAPYRKSIILKAIKEFKNEYDFTLNSKFRNEKCILTALYNFYALCKQQAVMKVNCIHQDVKTPTKYIPLVDEYQITSKLKCSSPVLFCINDGESCTDADRRYLKYFLQKYFPKVAQWEKNDGIEEDKIFWKNLEYGSDVDIDSNCDLIEPVYQNSNSINIVFAPDNSFCKYFGVTLQSLISNAKSEFNYDIIVFEHDITRNNKERLLKMLPENCSLRFFNIDNYIKRNHTNVNLRPQAYWSISMYYRIFIPLIMEKYDKILYLDSDTCINDSLVELFNTDLGDKEIAVAKDSISYVLDYEKWRKSYMLNTLKMDKPENYFNSGMILFNNKNIDKEDYLNRFYQSLKIEKLCFPDQDMLNYIFCNRSYILDKKWNFEYGPLVESYYYLTQLSENDRADYEKSKKDIRIIHFTSDQKPWIFPNLPDTELFWKYARISPFYEEIIYNNLSAKFNVIIQRKKTYCRYAFYKILSNFVFGNLKQEINDKKGRLKVKVNRYRQIKEIKF